MVHYPDKSLFSSLLLFNENRLYSIPWKGGPSPALGFRFRFSRCVPHPDSYIASALQRIPVAQPSVKKRFSPRAWINSLAVIHEVLCFPRWTCKLGSGRSPLLALYDLRKIPRSPIVLPGHQSFCFIQGIGASDRSRWERKKWPWPTRGDWRSFQQM